MPQKQIAERSPVRVLERALGGGLGAGNIGVVLSRPGVGKTGFLIGLALDALLRGRHVLHISTVEPVERVRDYYDQIFRGVTEELQLPDVAELRLDLERRRHILVYNRKLFSLEKLESSVEFLREGAGFQPSLVLMDGTPRYEHTEPWEMEGLARLAHRWQAEIWTAANLHREGQALDGHGVPTELGPLQRWLAVILCLEPSADHVRVRVLKDHDRDGVPDLQLEYDPQTLLLRWR